ncbi:MAG: hypothetical protein ABH817_00135 [archaeon]
MKKLESESVREKKKHRSNVIMSLFIAGILILSTAGFAILSGDQNDPGDISYNSYTFARTQNGWKTNVDQYQINTYYLPQEVENITDKLYVPFSYFQNEAVYILATSQEERQAAGQLWNNLQYIALRIQLACSEENAEDEFCVSNNFPIIGCDEDKTVIWLKDSDEEVSYSNKCLKIHSGELLKTTENIIFQMFNII